MAEITDPKQAGERLMEFLREGRLVQNTWHDEQDGREIACLLGAAAGIRDAGRCPASLMPKWMAWALPDLFDGQSKAHAQTFARRWGEAMIRPEWRRIDWDAVRDGWMVFVEAQSKDATAAAAAHAAGDAAAYAASYAASYAAHAAAGDAARRADADAAYAYAAAYAAARDAQADALMDAIEKSMEVARG